MWCSVKSTGTSAPQRAAHVARDPQLVAEHRRRGLHATAPRRAGPRVSSDLDDAVEREQRVVVEDDRVELVRLDEASSRQ